MLDYATSLGGDAWLPRSGAAQVSILAPIVELVNILMKEIPLFGKHGVGKVALVDDEDFELVSKYRWRVNLGGYVTACIGFKDGKTLNSTMHRVILNYPPMIDHINRNKLDNRKENLRLCDYSTNMLNRDFGENYGVHFYANVKKNPYYTKIKKNKKEYYGGRFATREEAKQRFRELYRGVHGVDAP